MHACKLHSIDSMHMYTYSRAAVIAATAAAFRNVFIYVRDICSFVSQLLYGVYSYKTVTAGLACIIKAHRGYTSILTMSMK